MNNAKILLRQELDEIRLGLGRYRRIFRGLFDEYPMLSLQSSDFNDVLDGFDLLLNNVEELIKISRI